MEEGSLRCDANVSVRAAGTPALGTKAEVKNLNSFRFLQKALEHEIERQIDVLEEGGRIVQETRLWDANAGRTVSMRSKEHAHDYRYFPEPDLPPVIVSEERIARIRAEMPELPAARRERFVEQYALPPYVAGQLTTSRGLADYFEATVAAGASARAASNWIMGDVARTLNERHLDITASPIPPARLAGLLGLIDKGALSGSMAKTVFEKIVATGRSADDIVKTEGLAQIDDDAQLRVLIEDVLAKNSDAVAQLRAGKSATLGFLVGQVMKAAAGKANPKRVNELLQQALSP
jgi:aspartyl-tRNA(Asn)/glutamyl-tRNA(Gln) amidotransferase subunit B